MFRHTLDKKPVPATLEEAMLAKPKGGVWVDPETGVKCEWDEEEARIKYGGEVVRISDLETDPHLRMTKGVKE